MWEDGSIWASAREGRLDLRACATCAAICHPPLPMCPGCQSTSWVQHATTGRATLVSWLVSVDPGETEVEPRIVIVVRLDEGVNFVSNLVGAQVESLHEGMALELCFAASGDLALPLFRPAEGGA